MPWWLQKELDKLQQRQQQQIFHNNYHFYNKNHSHNHLLLLPQHLHLQDTTISASSSITTATTFITTTTTTTTITTTIKTTRISYCPGHLRNGNIFFLKLLQGSEYCLFSHVEFHQNFKRNAFHFFCLRNIRGRPMYRSCFWLFFQCQEKDASTVFFYWWGCSEFQNFPYDILKDFLPQIPQPLQWARSCRLVWWQM